MRPDTARILLGTSPPTFHGAVGAVMGWDTPRLTTTPKLGSSLASFALSTPALARLVSEAPHLHQAFPNKELLSSLPPNPGRKKGMRGVGEEGNRNGTSAEFSVLTSRQEAV